MNYMWRFEILKTDMGEKLRNPIINEIPIVFRPRFSGIVREDGTIDIVKIFSFDAILKNKDLIKENI
jgi:hypothetical protein